MWASWHPRQRVGAMVLASLGIVSAGVIGKGYLDGQRAPIVLTSEPGPGKVGESSMIGPQPKPVVVDVEGAVRRPGIQRLTDSTRVFEAIEAAGGKTSDADTGSLNLAAKLIDGSQVYVPSKTRKDVSKVSPSILGGELAPNPYSNTPSTPKTSGRAAGGKHPASPVSLNTGSKSQFETLPGVGPSTADKIIQYRQEHGGFTSINELLAVKGIGPKKLKAMKPFLRL